MGLKDALEKRTKPRRQCGWVALLDRLNDEDQQAATDAINDPDRPVVDILDALRDEGHLVTDRFLYRHKKGSCSCPSETD